jgi:hypothetical protein
MTFSLPACHDDHPIGTHPESFQNQAGIDSAGAHHPYNFKIGRIGVAGSAGGVGGLVGAPVTKKSDDFRLKNRHRVSSRHFFSGNLSFIADCVNINYDGFEKVRIVFLDTASGFILIPINKDKAYIAFRKFISQGSREEIIL